MDLYNNPLSIGVDIETGGHVFQLHFSNSTGMKPMSDTRIFLDSNVLLYLQSADAEKANRAELCARNGGVISVQERANYMARVRDLAKGSCKAWIDSQSERWTAKYPGWVL